jgi:hypothetical protein
VVIVIDTEVVVIAIAIVETDTETVTEVVGIEKDLGVEIGGNQDLDHILPPPTLIGPHLREIRNADQEAVVIE